MAKSKIEPKKENLFNINQIEITDVRYDLPDGRYGNICFHDLLCILNKEERRKILSMARTLINDDLCLDVIRESKEEKPKKENLYTEEEVSLAVNYVIGDDGFRSTEVISLLRTFLEERGEPQ